VHVEYFHNVFDSSALERDQYGLAHNQLKSQQLEQHDIMVLSSQHFSSCYGNTYAKSESTWLAFCLLYLHDIHAETCRHRD
jgi:hypothetical protein